MRERLNTRRLQGPGCIDDTRNNDTLGLQADLLHGLSLKLETSLVPMANNPQQTITILSRSLSLTVIFSHSLLSHLKGLESFVGYNISSLLSSGRIAAMVFKQRHQPRFTPVASGDGTGRTADNNHNGGEEAIGSSERT